MNRPDVLVIGEALIDVHDDGMTVRERVGGSAGNVAVGLARLGRDTLLHTAIGADEHGREISAYLAASGVGLSRSSVTQGASSVARAVLRVDGSARHDFRIHWAPAADPGTLSARCVHAGSIAAYLEPGAGTVLDLVTGSYGRSLITFDAKVEPALVGPREAARRRALEFVALAGIVKASERDLAFLYPDDHPLDVLRDWVGRGPDLAVLTRGPRGATAVTARGIVDVPGIPVLYAEAGVGGGDAFMSTLIDSALTLGSDAGMRWVRSGAPVVEQVLARSVQAAALTVARLGAVPPTADELASAGPEALTAG
ncbi:PfkB family carbohydrate kinase [Cellulomonas fengjieae]|uniref:Carbohydrate kinase n=1 Tax=Cellulomonas fengjieae TaxID=2819978 RepID=A0ABS3SKW0_9CELL|nr:PfkB family carbohydrate kinase [Cellulomonas fengjieae]MBO3086382.1 carbohydrate kinase [Cellulomonas fengjieae]QVI66746.1 carbohydrate kinase [Cellulomonas fengjieae]